MESVLHGDNRDVIIWWIHGYPQLESFHGFLCRLTLPCSTFLMSSMSSPILQITSLELGMKQILNLSTVMISISWVYFRKDK